MRSSTRSATRQIGASGLIRLGEIPEHLERLHDSGVTNGVAVHLGETGERAWSRHARQGEVEDRQACRPRPPRASDPSDGDVAR